MIFKLEEQLSFINHDIGQIEQKLEKNKQEALKLAYLDIEKRDLEVKLKCYSDIKTGIINLMHAEEKPEALTQAENPWGEIQ